MTDTTLTNSNSTADRLVEQLRDRADKFDGLLASGAELKLVKEVHRRFCEIYMFRISPTADHPELVVKVPVGHSDIAYQEHLLDSSFVDRPRLFSRVNAESKSWKEYAALCRIQAHFDAKQDPRFGVVRVYDLLPEQQAMVMQWIDQPSLRQQLYATHRFSRKQKSDQLACAFAHTGAWLRDHHQLAPLEHCEHRNSTRDDYLESVESFVAYLVDHVSNADELRSMHQRIIELSSEYLPSSIPTGQVHGDFAPRNVFIGPSNRVSVFDTLGRFEAPIYEDIAKMLMTVHASGPQMLSRGMMFDRKRLHRYEESFLEGYFQDLSIPRETIKLFLAQLMLEHWAAVVYQHKQRNGLKQIAKGVRRSLWQAGFVSYLRRILDLPGHNRFSGEN